MDDRHHQAATRSGNGYYEAGFPAVCEAEPIAADRSGIAYTTANPDHPGLYVVELVSRLGTTHHCARWDGECWSLWVDYFDPPEWDPVVMLNSRVTSWHLPGPQP